jgi:hypothetical protein
MSRIQQSIRVDYCVSDKFIVPKGINLNNDKQVESYDIKYNTLRIYLTNGEMVEVESEGWIREFDYKYPMDDENTVEEEEVDDEDKDDDEEEEVYYFCDRCQEIPKTEKDEVYNRVFCVKCKCTLDE